ncbi:MAG: hypothetical protein IKA36_01580 [Clostridia bacterium]|nr:hypothetical protein [Clostridia bacterium]
MNNNNLYYDSNESSKVVEVTSDESIAAVQDVLDKYGFKDVVYHQQLFGKMPNNGSWKHSLKVGERINIPEGYHDGTGYVECPDIIEATEGSATAEDIAFNKVAWVNGQRIVGTLDKNENDQSATATAEDIKEGKTAWVNRELIEGTMIVYPRMDTLLNPDDNFTIGRGFHTGDTIISTYPLEYITPGDAGEYDISAGKTAWVNGKQITGQYVFENTIAETIGDNEEALAPHIREGKTAVTGKGVVIGVMPDHLNESPRTVSAGATYTIPEGYHDGNGTVKGELLSAQTVGNATENDIREGKIAWVNGQQIVGKMVQYVTDATDTTATVYDITAGKTAYINGGKYEGVSPYNTVHHVHTADNIDTPLEIVVHTLPHDMWNMIPYIAVKLMDSATNTVVKEEVIIEYNNAELYEGSFFTITSEIGVNKITITPTYENETEYISSVIVGYTIYSK